MTALALLLSAPAARAQAPEAPNCPPPARVDPQILSQLVTQPQPNRGFLWRLSKNGKHFHLYGTVHVARLEWDSPGPVIRDALQASRSLAVELDITSREVVGRILGTAAESALPGSSPPGPAGPPLSPERIAALDHQIAKACLNRDLLRNTPLPTQVAMLTLLSARHEGLYPDFAIDAALIGYARAQGKPIIELETAQEHAEALDDPERPGDGLASLVSGEATGIMKTTLTAWASSDLQTMQNFAQWCQCVPHRDGKPVADKLISKRNDVLATRIAQYYENHPNGFAAIGVFHLFGENSVLAQLERAGYVSRQVWPRPGLGTHKPISTDIAR